MANPITSQPILLLLIAFLSITPPTHSLCSHSIITSLSSSGFTHFAHALHSHNLSAAATTRPTCLVFPDSAFLGRPVSPNTIAAHVLPSLALPLESLLRLRPNTALPTLCRKTTLVSGTDGKTVSLNNVLITAPNLHVDDSCVVHGVEGPLIDDNDDVIKNKINVTTPRRHSIEVVRFIRRSDGQVLELQREVSKIEVMDNQLSLYDGSYNVAGSDENISSDGKWHPCLFFSPNYSQEEFLRGLLSSSCRNFSSTHGNEDERVGETYEEEEQLPYYGCGNWLSEYEHSFCDSWGDGHFSLGNGIQENEEGSELKKVEEDSGQCEQHYESSPGHEVTQEHYPTFDSSTWSCDSWFACGGKFDSHGYNEQESTTSHSYYPPEIGVYESMFGYWPCLYRY